MEAVPKTAGGPEGVNPFWSDPKDEEKNMEAMEGHLEKYEESLGENEQLIFALAKSDNRNVAAFVMDTAKSISDEDCIRTMWLVVDPKKRAEFLKSKSIEDVGQMVVVPCNALERAYLGCRVSQDEDDANKRRVDIAAFDDANLDDVPEFELVRSGTDFWIRTGSLGDFQSRADRAYVQMSKGTTRRVDYLTIYGTSLDDRDVQKRFVNENVA